MLRVAKIRMEYLENPVGLGELPWFGWILESDRRCVIQQGYRLQIGADEEFTCLVFDSGHVESGESLHVEAVRNTLPGTEGKTVLQSCKRYFVRVRVWDEQEVCLPGRNGKRDLYPGRRPGIGTIRRVPACAGKFRSGPGWRRPMPV